MTSLANLFQALSEFFFRCSLFFLFIFLFFCVCCWSSISFLFRSCFTIHSFARIQNTREWRFKTKQKWILSPGNLIPFEWKLSYHSYHSKLRYSGISSTFVRCGHIFSIFTAVLTFASVISLSLYSVCLFLFFSCSALKIIRPPHCIIHVQHPNK